MLLAELYPCQQFVVSDHRHAAVYVDRLAGDVAGLVGGEIGDGGGDFGAGSHALGGNGANQALKMALLDVA